MEKFDYKLDSYQNSVVVDNSKYLLVCAGAGSGKTFTILFKIKYLIERKSVLEDEIICISFTNEATNNLKDRLSALGYNISCYTFHKLALEVLNKDNYKICSSNFLCYVITEYLKSLININPENKVRVLKFLMINFNRKNYSKKYSQILDYQFIYLVKLIERFISLFKSNGYDEKDLIGFIRNEKNGKNKGILIVILYVYKTYELELKSKREIDFNDIILYATDKVNRDGFIKKIKYIIIDEFQDTSKIRFNFIKSIIDSTNCSLLAVGDDFQSIYRFSGSNLSLFQSFTNYFSDAKVLKLVNTYRNSQELINIAGSFVMKNSFQLKKQLISFKHDKFPIVIIYYFNIVSVFIKLINYIFSLNRNPILILGRNNFDINILLDSDKFKMEKDELIYKDNCEIKLRYLTIHASKGLEYDNVIIINLINSINGFPNKISDNSILNYVLINDEKYLFSEERRLMYVALTRTLNKCYLLVPFINQSVFVKEIRKDFKKQIKIVRNF